MAWQLGITLTFCHAAIDLIRDFYPDVNKISPLTMHFFWVLVMTSLVAFMVSYFSRKDNSVRNLFLLLIWSCIGVAFLRLGIRPDSLKVTGLSFCEVICVRFFVDIFFTLSAIAISWIIMNKFKLAKS